MAKNYKVKVDEDGVATAEERTTTEAIGDTLSGLISGDTASVGYVSTIVTAALGYGIAVLTAKQHTGEWSFNPFA